MSTKDKNILGTSGKYPFNVSDEYFDNLAARIMEQIPEENNVQKAEELSETKVIDINAKRNSKNLWIKAISIAACFSLVVILSIKFFPSLSNEEEASAEVTQEYTDDDYNEDLMYYSMADYGDVYSYLSGAE